MTQIHLTKEKFLDKSPCPEGLAFAESLNFDFVKIWNKCKRGDWLIWLLLNFNLAGKVDYVKISVACAEVCIKNYEKQYPNDDRPRKAIKAAKNWISNPCEKSWSAVRSARSAAWSAAWSAESAAWSAESAVRSAESAEKEQADMIREIIKCPFLKKEASND